MCFEVQGVINWISGFNSRWDTEKEQFNSSLWKRPNKWLINYSVYSIASLKWILREFSSVWCIPGPYGPLKSRGWDPGCLQLGQFEGGSSPQVPQFSHQTWSCTGLLYTCMFMYICIIIYIYMHIYAQICVYIYIISAVCAIYFDIIIWHYTSTKYQLWSFGLCCFSAHPGSPGSPDTPRYTLRACYAVGHDVI